MNYTDDKRLIDTVIWYGVMAVFCALAFFELKDALH